MEQKTETNIPLRTRRDKEKGRGILARPRQVVGLSPRLGSDSVYVIRPCLLPHRLPDATRGDATRQSDSPTRPSGLEPAHTSRSELATGPVEIVILSNTWRAAGRKEERLGIILRGNASVTSPGVEGGL